MSSSVKGFLFVIIGAICFSVKAVIIKIAYRYGIDSVSLLTLRMGFAMPFFALIPLIYKQKTKPVSINKSDWIQISILAILGYYLSSILDFWGLQYISAGLERLILFSYPSFVVIISTLWFKSKITKPIILALLFTYIGLGIIFSTSHFNYSNNFTIGSILISLASISYAFYLAFSSRMIVKLGAVVYNSYVMLISCVAVLIHFAIAQPTAVLHFTSMHFVFGITLAIISTVIPTFLMAEGLRRIGANKMAITASIGPVATIILGYYFLGETVTLIEILGTALIVIGIVVLGMGKAKK